MFKRVKNEEKNVKLAPMKIIIVGSVAADRTAADGRVSLICLKDTTEAADLDHYGCA